MLGINHLSTINILIDPSLILDVFVSNRSTIKTMGLNSRQPPGKTCDFTISSSTELKLVFPTKKWGASEH
jgi:hypothetical protein